MPEGGPSFSSVRKARALLREKSLETYEAYMNLAKMAAANRDFETAEKIFRYILDHTVDDDNTPLLGPSVDKPKQVESGSKGPAITIGVAIGGLGQPKQLSEAPAIEVIDVRPESDSN